MELQRGLENDKGTQGYLKRFYFPWWSLVFLDKWKDQNYLNVPAELHASWLV